MGPFAPEAVAGPGTETAGAAGTLLGTRPGDAHRLQAGHASRGVEARPALVAGVDHHAHPLDGQAGLGDIGRQHHLAPRTGEDRPFLLGEGELAVEGADIDLPGQVGKRSGAAADLEGAGEEDQHVAVRLGQGPAHRRRHGVAHPSGRLLGKIIHRHRVAAPGAADPRAVAEESGHRSGIEGRRHHQQLQILAQTELGVAAEGQGEVGIEVALVELVENHQADAGQFRVGLQPAGEDPLGDHLDAGGLRDPALVADSVADRLSHPLAALFRHKARGVAGGQPPRLEHEDGAPGQPRLVEEGRRHPGSLAGAWGRLKDRRRMGGEGLAQIGEDGVDGEG